MAANGLSWLGYVWHEAPYSTLSYDVFHTFTFPYGKLKVLKERVLQRPANVLTFNVRKPTNTILKLSISPEIFEWHPLACYISGRIPLPPLALARYVKAT